MTHLTILFGQKVNEKHDEGGAFGVDIGEDFFWLKVLFPAQDGA